MRKAFVLLCLLSLAAVLPASAQTEHNTIARIVEVTVKSGMGHQFTEGVKKYHQWEHQHNVPGTYYVWVVVSGDRYGHYLFGTFGHDWKDFDDMEKNTPAGSGDELRADVGAYVENVKISYWTLRTDLTSTRPNPAQPPAKFLTVTTFTLKPGGGENVTDAIKEANKAIKKSNWAGKPAMWYSLLNGGEGNQLVLASGRKDWADFQPPEKTFGMMLNEVYGKEGAEALGHKFNKQIRSVRSEIFRYLPELSYIPKSM